VAAVLDVSNHAGILAEALAHLGHGDVGGTVHEILWQRDGARSGGAALAHLSDRLVDEVAVAVVAAVLAEELVDGARVGDDEIVIVLETETDTVAVQRGADGVHEAAHGADGLGRHQIIAPAGVTLEEVSVVHRDSRSVGEIAVLESGEVGRRKTLLSVQVVLDVTLIVGHGEFVHSEVARRYSHRTEGGVVDVDLILTAANSKRNGGNRRSHIDEEEGIAIAHDCSASISNRRDALVVEVARHRLHKRGNHNIRLLFGQGLSTLASMTARGISGGPFEKSRRRVIWDAFGGEARRNAEGLETSGKRSQEATIRAHVAA